jgi:hypothetical protein
VRSSRTRFQSLAVLVAAVTIGAACGSDDDTADGGAESTPSTPTPSTPTPSPSTPSTSTPSPTPPTSNAPTSTPTNVDTDDTSDDTSDDISDEGAVEVDEAAPRLVIADGVDPTAQVVDQTTGEVVAVIELPGVSSVYGLGRHVLAAVREAGRVEFIDAGTWAEAHGDHANHFVDDPVLLDVGLDADQPTHVVAHDGLVAVFDDGDGIVTVLDRARVGDDDAVVTTIDSGAPHHGVAVALEEHGVALISTPVDGEALPDGVAVVDLDSGDEVERFDGCPELHGEVSTASAVAFGCADGVLVLEPHGDHWHAVKVDRPTGADGDVRTGTLVAGHDSPFLIGNLGPSSLVRVDLDDATATAIPLPAEMSSFAVDEHGDRVLVLTVDGQLHRLDPLTGEIAPSIAVVDPFELPSGHGGSPVPRVTTAGTHAFVTDPTGGRVISVEIADLVVDRTFTVGGAPASVALAGLAPDDQH